MNWTQTADDAKVTFESVEADGKFIVIRFNVQDLRDDRRIAGNPAALEPVLGTGPAEALPPHIGHLTDDAGRKLGLVGAEMEGFGSGDAPQVRRAPKANRAVFARPARLEPGTGHRFRFEVSLEEIPVPSSWEEAEEVGVLAKSKPPIGPFIFDFEIPAQRKKMDLT